MKKYEGMFLFDPAVTSDWEAVQAEFGRLMERVSARVIVNHKWDERRLAYEIKGRKRAIYALTFFECEPGRIPDLERDVRLSEAVLRCLIMQADHLTEDEMKEIAARPADHSLAEAERIGGRPGGPRQDDRDRDRDRGRDRDRDRDRGGDRRRRDEPRPRSETPPEQGTEAVKAAEAGEQEE